MRKFSPTISVVTIARNEEKTIRKVINESIQILTRLASKYEILVNDDASTDRTPEILSSLKKENKNIKVYRQAEPLGIAGGMNFLYEKAKYDYIFINPGDGQYSAKDLPKMMKKIEEGYDIVVGKRINKKYDVTRKAISYLYNILPKFLFKADTYDAGSTKVYKTKVIKKIPIISSGIFDEAERLIRAQKLGYKLSCVPVRHLRRLSGRATGAKLSLILEGVKDMLKLRFVLLVSENKNELIL